MKCVWLGSMEDADLINIKVKLHSVGKYDFWTPPGPLGGGGGGVWLSPMIWHSCFFWLISSKVCHVQGYSQPHIFPFCLRKETEKCVGGILPPLTKHPGAIPEHPMGYKHILNLSILIIWYAWPFMLSVSQIQCKNEALKKYNTAKGSKCFNKGKSMSDKFYQTHFPHRMLC